MNFKICFRIALIMSNVGCSLVAALPAYSQQDYTGIVIIEAYPWAVRTQCMTNFIKDSYDSLWCIKRPMGLGDSERMEAAHWAYVNLGQPYPWVGEDVKGPVTFHCAGLVEAAYEKTTPVNLTSDKDETDGICWPRFYPSEQAGSLQLINLGKPMPQDIKPGDIIYRTSRVWVVPNYLIPGRVDHVGIVYKTNALVDTCCQPYIEESEYEVCDDGVDNDNDGLIDEMDPDCGASSTFTILRDSIILVEQSQTQAYIPFSLCNDGCLSLTIDYRITSMGHIAPPIYHAGTVNVAAGGCEDVYGIIDAGAAALCTFDTLTIIAWTTVGEETHNDTCTQLIHVIEPLPVANLTPPFIAILASGIILLAAIFIRKRSMSIIRQINC